MSLQIGGLASGMDMDLIIEHSTAIARQSITSMQRKQQDLEIQKNAWRDINSRMRNLADKFLSLKLETTYLGRVAKASNEAVLRASASPGAVEGNYHIDVKKLATAAAYYSEGQVIDADAAIGEGVLAIKVNLDEEEHTVNIAIDEKMSLRDLAKNINELKIGEGDQAQSLPLRATIVGNHLVLTSKETGAGNDFTVTIDEGSSDTLKATFGSFERVIGSGEDAELEINGIHLSTASNTLKDVIEGITLTLQEEGKTTLAVSQDTKQVVDKIQEFVDQYNSVIEFMNEKLQAKSAMDSNSVRGSLSGDGTLLRLQSTLRSIVAGSVGGEGKHSSLSDIGISTAKFVKGAADYSGKLILDTAKLEAALKEDPLAVKELLFNTSDVEVDGKTVSKETGLFHNLESHVREFTRAGDGIFTEKDKAYDERIADIKKQVERAEARLEMRKERLTNQFVALEKVLSTMQSQGDWLSMQITQLNNMYTPRNR